MINRQIRKLEKLVDENLHKSRKDILEHFGKPSEGFNNDVWFYWLQGTFHIFKYEIAIIFEEDEVVDLCMTQYFFWKEIRSFFYYEGEIPQYRIINNIL